MRDNKERGVRDRLGERRFMGGGPGGPGGDRRRPPSPHRPRHGVLTFHQIRVSLFTELLPSLAGVLLAILLHFIRNRLTCLNL